MTSFSIKNVIPNKRISKLFSELSLLFLFIIFTSVKCEAEETENIETENIDKTKSGKGKLKKTNS